MGDLVNLVRGHGVEELISLGWIWQIMTFSEACLSGLKSGLKIKYWLHCSEIE